MKYLKKSAEVLIGKAGVQKSHLSDYTATLVLPTHYSDGSGDDLLGIQVTREHLEQFRNEIDRYLSETADNKPEPEPESVKFVNNFNLKSIELKMSEEEVNRILTKIKQPSKLQRLQNSCQEGIPVEIDPKLVMVNQLKPTEEPDSWFAKICVLTGVLSDLDGKLEVSVLGASEENARAKLNTGFHDLIMTCINPDSLESRIPDIVRENQHPVNSPKETKFKPLEFDLSKLTSKKIDKGWEARIVYCSNGCKRQLTEFGDTETEARAKLYKWLIFLLQGELPADRFSSANEPEISKQISETDDKDSALLKLNPSRVMSIKIGANKWEARTKLFNWTSDGLTDLVATADSEEAAREELDKKFSNLARPMTNFIKFMKKSE